MQLCFKRILSTNVFDNDDNCVVIEFMARLNNNMSGL